MARETVFTAIIPAILIFFLVFFNIRKMQKQAKITFLHPNVQQTNLS